MRKTDGMCGAGIRTRARPGVIQQLRIAGSFESRKICDVARSRPMLVCQIAEAGLN